MAGDVEIIAIFVRWGSGDGTHDRNRRFMMRAVRADVDLLLLAFDLPEDNLWRSQHEQITDAVRHQPKLSCCFLTTVHLLDSRYLVQRPYGISDTGGVLEVQIAHTAQIIMVHDVFVLDDRHEHGVNSRLRQLSSEIDGPVFG